MFFVIHEIILYPSQNISNHAPLPIDDDVFVKGLVANATVSGNNNIGDTHAVIEGIIADTGDRRWQL